MSRAVHPAGDAHRKDLGEWADAWVARISALYAAHRRLAPAPEGSPQAARADAAFGAALDEIDAHRRIQGRRPDLLHPAAAKVLATLDREWDGLAAHREFPSLPLDNNTAERAIRTPVVGRKNYTAPREMVSGPGRARLDDPGHRQDGRAKPPRLPGRLPGRLRRE